MKTINIFFTHLFLCTLCLGLSIEVVSAGILRNSKFSVNDSLRSVETNNLLKNLKTLQGNGVIIGQEEAFSFGRNWQQQVGRSDMKDVCGQHPALFGWDLGVIKMRGNSDYPLPTSLNKLRTYIKHAYKIGGINTVSVHPNNPLTGGSSWDTTNAVSTALPGGSNHSVYLKWLDKVADFFLSLTDENGNPIPVIFRPFHEDSGHWFWWCKPHCTKEEYVNLWRFTADYLRNERRVRNLLFAYTPTEKFANTDEFLERYPGDGYVDIIGFDFYHTSKKATPSTFVGMIRRRLTILQSIAHEKDKLFAIAETGNDNISSTSKWWTEVLKPCIDGFNLSYVMIWRQKHYPEMFFGPYPGQESVSDFKQFEAMPETIFVNDLPSMYK